MLTIQKEKRHAFGKDIYLLGRFKDGHTFWLEEPSWDYGWYWGFGYVKTYTRKAGPPAKDIQSHQHYQGLCLSKSERWDYEKRCFVPGPYIYILSDHPDVDACALTKEEQWRLSDLMSMAYTLKKAAEVYHHGNAYLTTHNLTPELKQPDREKTINEVELPAIFAAVRKLLTPLEEK